MKRRESGEGVREPMREKLAITRTRFVVEIDMDGDAFQPLPGVEVGRILNGIAEEVRYHSEVVVKDPSFPVRPLQDVNGNRVGRWYVWRSAACRLDPPAR